MDIKLREGRPEDARACGAIAYEAFKSVAEEHNFPPDFPDSENAVMVLSFLLASPSFHKVVAELDGRVVGSNFLDERNPIAGIGPITVDRADNRRPCGPEPRDRAAPDAGGDGTHGGAQLSRRATRTGGVS